MSILLAVLLFLIIFVCVGVLMPQGAWSGALMLVNVFFAGLLATNFWEPAANRLEDWIGAGGTYLYDFAVIWLLFYVFFSILRLATDMISKTQFRLPMVAEWICSFLFAFLVGWVMVCFTLMTLHLAPLGRESFAGGFDPDTRMLVGSAPDRRWLGRMHIMSKANFARGNPQLGQAKVFDPRAEFIAKYAERRAEYEQLEGLLAPEKP